MTEKSWPRHHIPAARVLGDDGVIAHLHRFGARMEREIKDLKANAEALAAYEGAKVARRIRESAALILHEALAMTFFEIRQAEKILGVKPNGEVSAWQLEREALQRLGERADATNKAWAEKYDVVVADNAAMLALLRVVDDESKRDSAPCPWCGCAEHAVGCSLKALLDAEHPGKEVLDRLGALELDVESLNEDVGLATRSVAEGERRFAEEVELSKARHRDLNNARDHLTVVREQRDFGWQLLDAIGEDFELATDPTADSNKSAEARRRIGLALRGRPVESTRMGLPELSWFMEEGIRNIVGCPSKEPLLDGVKKVVNNPDGSTDVYFDDEDTNDTDKEPS